MLYNDYFGFREAPFSIAPDPRFLFMGSRHQEAFAHLLYGFRNEGGFVLLTGEVGTGKTTVSRCLLEQVGEDTEVAYIVNPRLSAVELLSAICDELGIPQPQPPTIKALVDAINRRLLANHGAGKRTVLVIDEAQNLDADVLEQIRLLTNLETSSCKLLQIILIGQPELRDKLARPELRQLAQRITARYHLTPLAAGEIKGYVEHRLRVAGGDPDLFSRRCLPLLYRWSGGVPRLINVICDRALLGAYTENSRQITPRIVRRAAAEVLGFTDDRRRRRWTEVGLVAGLLLAAVLVPGRLALEPGPPVPVADTQGASVAAPISSTEPMAEAEPVVASEPPEAREMPPAEDREADAEAADEIRWRDRLPAGYSRRAAFADLFARWGVAYPADEPLPPCTFARTKGLRCFYTVTRLDDLHRLNRPAVLQMFDEDGREFFASLVGMTGDRAVLQAGSDEWRLSWRSVALAWSGRATVLWRPPPGYTDAVAPGGRGPVVAWLGKRLGRPGSEPAVYDNGLVAMVKRLQIDNGLVPDGALGSRSLLVIQNCLGTTDPVLDPGRQPACEALAGK